MSIYIHIYISISYIYICILNAWLLVLQLFPWERLATDAIRLGCDDANMTSSSLPANRRRFKKPTSERPRRG